MSPSQAAYEVRHFLAAPRAENDMRQKWVLEKWGFAGVPGGRVMEIGPGPYGGCLPFIEAAEKVAVDPLYQAYRASRLLDWNENWVVSPRYVEDLRSESIETLRCDAILCFNVLEHGTSGFDSIDKIVPMMKPGGRFYLEQSLRTAAQLNEAHDHVMTLGDLHAAIERNGLEVIQHWVEPPQPGFDYPAVIGIYEKGAHHEVDKDNRGANFWELYT